LFAYLLSLTGSALFFGILLNLFAPASWFPLQSEHSMHHHEILPHWLKLASAILLSILLLHALLRKYIPSAGKTKTQLKPSHTMQIHTMNVKGMTCSHCRANVEGAISGIEGVEKVEIELSSGKVSVEGENLRPEEIRKAVEAVGYQVLPENQDSSAK
jgi:copper chaperone CopZ